MVSFTDYTPRNSAAASSPHPESAPASLSSPSGIRSAVRDAARGGRVLSILIAVRAWLEDFAAAVRAFYGTCEFTIGDLRGYVDVCSICLIDVHELGVVCPSQAVGDCDLCAGTVMLDRFGNCAMAGERWRFHYISNRRSYVAGQIKPREVIAMK